MLARGAGAGLQPHGARPASAASATVGRQGGGPVGAGRWGGLVEACDFSMLADEDAAEDLLLHDEAAKGGLLRLSSASGARAAAALALSEVEFAGA